jgi:hypothetical protein
MLVQENGSIPIATPNPCGSRLKRFPNLAKNQQVGMIRFMLTTF